MESFSSILRRFCLGKAASRSAIHEMEREVEQNELPIVNKNTRKKQKKLSKLAKMRQKHPISKIILCKKTDGFVWGKS